MEELGDSIEPDNVQDIVLLVHSFCRNSHSFVALDSFSVGVVLETANIFEATTTLVKVEERKCCDVVECELFSVKKFGSVIYFVRVII